MTKKKTRGFTIIEVLIATLIFSVVLLLSMQAVTRIGYLYFKGVSSVRIQELARQLSDEITQQIQFGSRPPITNSVDGILPNSDPENTPLVFCIGDNRYRAVLNREMGTEADSILLRESVGGIGECDPDPTTFGSGAVELGTKGMRIQNLTVQRVADGVWFVRIRLGLGGADLYENLESTPGVPNDDPDIYREAVCQSGISGSQYCATSDLESSILRRINVE